MMKSRLAGAGSGWRLFYFAVIIVAGRVSQIRRGNGMTEEDFMRIETLLVSQLGGVEESIQHKLDLVVEGQQLLSERMDRLETDLREDIRRVDGTVTCVGADLSAHRGDTEGHRGAYQVREE